MQKKKNPWETDSEESENISDFSGVSDGGSDSDGDFRPATKKAKSNGSANGSNNKCLYERQ
jgi:hypothetical protein